MTAIDRRMRGISPVRTARGDERPRCAQTGRECSPRTRRCQRIVRRAGLPVLAAAVAVAAVAAGAATAPAAAASPDRPTRKDAVAAARALGARLAGVTGLTARFTQTLDSASLPEPQVEEGTLFLLRPGRMRWEYTRPPGKLALADGTRTWLYTPEDRQVLMAPLAGSAAEGATLLMQDAADLTAEFDASWSRERGADDRPLLALKPRVAGATYDRILVATDATGFPITLTVLDALGGRVVYRFSDLKFARTLDPDLFRFTPPPGVPVQEIGR